MQPRSILSQYFVIAHAVFVFITCGCEPSPQEVAPECTAGGARPCGPSIGECEPGAERCVDGHWSGRCEGGIQPRAEICNYLDDDCDGEADGMAAALNACAPLSAGVIIPACGGFMNCRAEQCAPGLGDCDRDYANGCETDVTAQTRAACGGCVRCGAAQACVDDTCTDVPTDRTVTSFGGDGAAYPTLVAAHSDGTATVVGLFRGLISFSGSRLASESLMRDDMFVVRLRPNGTADWALDTAREPFSAAPDARGAVELPDGSLLLAGTASASFELRSVTVEATGPSVGWFINIAPDGSTTWSVVTEGGPFSVRGVAAHPLGFLAWGEAAGPVRAGGVTLGTRAGPVLALFAEDGTLLQSWETPLLETTAVLPDGDVLLVGNAAEPARLTVGASLVYDMAAEDGPMWLARVTLSSSPVVRWARASTAGRITVASSAVTPAGNLALVATASGYPVALSRQALTELRTGEPFAMRIDGADGSVMHATPVAGGVVVAGGNEDVAIVGANELHVLGADGSRAWSRAMASSPGRAIGGASDGRHLWIAGIAFGADGTVDGYPVVALSDADVFVWRARAF